MILPVLSLLTALSSLIHEMNLAQTLAAALGGTQLRYQTGFGLFTCFLGLGALLFARCRAQFSLAQIFIYSQMAMILVGGISPFIIKWLLFDLGLQAHDIWVRSLCYFPLVVVALLSGLELPALMSFSRRHYLSVLGWDYFGMFLGSLIYPLWLIYGFGVLGSAILASGLNLLAVAIFWMGQSSLKEATVEPMVPISKDVMPKFLVAGLAVVFAFSGMCYELLAAKAVTDLIFNEVLAHALTLGVFILGLSIGAFFSDQTRRLLPALFGIEFLVVLVALLAPSLYHLSASAWMLLWPFRASGGDLGFWILASLLPFSFLIGMLTGFEMPLLMRLSSLSPAFILTCSYFGSLLAGFFIAFFALPAFHLGPAFVVTALINFLALSTVVWFVERRFLFVGVPALIFLMFGFSLALELSAQTENAFLKINYYQLRLTSLNGKALHSLFGVLEEINPIQRQYTRYQTMDWVDRRDERLFKADEATLYLNRQPQLSFPHWQSYHDSMIVGGVNLVGGVEPKSALIIGGGDGLLAARILRYTKGTKIDLIELDPDVLEFATQNPLIRSMNSESLSNSRVQVTVGDGFSFLQETARKFDAILIDLPYPNNFDLSRVFSVEFYQAARGALNPGGWMVMDAPIWVSLDAVGEGPVNLPILAGTLKAAGFQTVKAFGPTEPFIFAQQEKRDPQFNYANLPADLPNRSFLNLKAVDFFEMDPTQKAKINSVFSPVRFQL